MQTALKKILSSFLILVGIVCFLIFGLFFHFAEIESVELKTDPQFKDTHWTPELKQKILSHLSGYKGRKIWTVELDEIARNLRDLYPAVQPRIYRQLPNRIVVFLKKKRAPSVTSQRSGRHSSHFRSGRSSTASEFESADGPARFTGRFFL